MVEKMSHDRSSNPRALPDSRTSAASSAVTSEEGRTTGPETRVGAVRDADSRRRLTMERLAAQTANRQMLLEVCKWEVTTLRNRLFKVGAIVQTIVRRIWIHLSKHWPGREVFQVVSESVPDVHCGISTAPSDDERTSLNQ